MNAEKPFMQLISSRIIKYFRFHIQGYVQI
jgi:hypothetical protein